METDAKRLGQEFFSAVAALDTVNRDNLAAAGTLQGARRVVLQREHDRLRQRYGTEHPRVKRIEARLLANQRLGHDIAVSFETRPVPTGGGSPADALLKGRVTDENKRGLGILTLSLVNPRNQRVPGAPVVQSDEYGNYKMLIDETTLPALTQNDQRKLFLAAFDAADKRLGRSTEPLTLEPGGRYRADLVIPRRMPPKAKRGGAGSKSRH